MPGSSPGTTNRGCGTILAGEYAARPLPAACKYLAKNRRAVASRAWRLACDDQGERPHLVLGRNRVETVALDPPQQAPVVNQLLRADQLEPELQCVALEPPQPAVRPHDMCHGRSGGS